MSNPNEPRGKRGCVIICLILFVGVPVLLFAVGAIWLQAWRSRGADIVEAELAKIIAAGEPVTTEDLELYYAHPDPDDDCTDLWLDATRPLDTEEFREAAKELPIVGDDESEIPSPGQPWAKLEAVEALLKQYSESLKKMHQAADERGAARYPTDFSQGIAMLTPHIEQLHKGMRLLVLQANVRARRGDAHGAAESLRAILRLAESLENEPALLSMLTRISGNSVFQGELARLVPGAGFSDADLAELQAELASIDYRQGLTRAMVGERVTGIFMFHTPGLVEEWAEYEGFWVPGNGWIPTNRDLAMYLSIMARHIDATKLPDPARIQGVEAVERQVDALSANANKFEQLQTLFTSLFVPAVAVTPTAVVRTETSKRAAIAFLAAERYRLKHKKLPERLGQLVPDFLDAVPIDPYDGQSLRYVVRDGQPIVYSVGKDRKDDGGHGNYPGEPDVTFPITEREEEE